MSTFCLVHAVLDLGRGVPEVERHDRGAAFEDAEIDGQPLETVHEQDGDLVALLDATRDQQVGKAVALLVEDAPGNLAPVGLGLGTLDEVVITPGDVLWLADLRVDFDKRHIIAVCSGIAAQKIDNRHDTQILLIRSSSTVMPPPCGQQCTDDTAATTK